MLEIYWGMLITGMLFALIAVIVGDLLSQALGGVLDWMSGDVLHGFHPMVVIGAVTVWGGAGVLLTRYTAMNEWIVLALSLLFAVGASVLIYFFYVKPMDRTESSIAFSMQDLVGRIGEVIVPIPSKGCGEVLIRVGGGVTNQIAESFDGKEIAAGSRVVAVEVSEGALRVSCVENELG